jgi:hypothetical protein
MAVTPLLDPPPAPPPPSRSPLPGRRRGGWRPVIWGGAVGGVLVLAAVLGTVLAITGGSLSCLNGSGGSSGPAPTKAATAAIPPERLVIYEQAGARFDIDWTFLASIGVQECSSGDCTGVNSSGCAGPMQIAYVPDSPCSPGSGPTLWDRYKVSASGGVPNVNDPADAIYTAARIFRQDLDAPPIGGSYHGYYEAACRYYGACADAASNYAVEVMARAVQFGFMAGDVPAGSTSGSSESSTGECSGVAVSGGPVDGSTIVRIAGTQLGVSEHPPGSNCTKYGPCEEWCALFVAWVWEHAGVPMPGGTAPYAYSGTIYTWAASDGGRDLPPTATPAPGDAVFYGSGVNDSVHMGIVERVFPDGEIVTIEGNDDNQVLRNGPFLPSQAVAAGEPAPIYGYAQPPTASGGVNA